MKKYKVIIVGAGTAGLSARREVAKKTDSYLVVDEGKLGTTCARVGCMPSKVLIQAANDFHRRHKLFEQGIENGQELKINTSRVMQHVRDLRDRFVGGVLSGMEDWKDQHFISGHAQFVDDHKIDIDGEVYEAEKFILALGSRPKISPSMFSNQKTYEDLKKDFKDFIVTTDELFELETLPASVCVFGLGVIGAEIGQAMSRLGVQVHGVTTSQAIGGSQDREIQSYILKTFREEFPIATKGGKIEAFDKDTGRVRVTFFDEETQQEKTIEVDKVIASIGRTSNLDGIKLESTSVKWNSQDKNLEVDPNTMKAKDCDHIFAPGDGNGERAILHEASDEGIVAGYNAVHDVECFKRRSPLYITFTDPNIAVAGKRQAEIEEDYVTGSVSFEGQGRSLVKLKNKGILKVFVSKKSKKILGAEMFCPDGEHLAHLLSWSISMDLTVDQVLKMPFYHPVVEEGLRTALRRALKEVDSNGHYFDLLRCQETIV